MIGLFHCPARSIQKFVLIAKMSLEEHFETHLKEKYANEQKEQNSEADIPDWIYSNKAILWSIVYVVGITVTKNKLYWCHGYLLVQNTDCRAQTGYEM